MKQTFKNKAIQLLKKSFLLGLLIFAVTIFEIYWSMGTLSEKMSSGCLDCLFFEDAFFISLLTTIFLTIVFILVSFIKNIYIKVVLELIFLISVWFFWNYNIFVDRESSWSTYAFDEELYYTFSFSIFPILVLSVSTVFFTNYISKKYKHKYSVLE
ncbi:hypothetical protein [Flavobacterium chilense]|uniref:Uncharacterized protein n=1 Tax=Flavobacterium chilense TaxID=946677 RepID=A0A1M7DTF4_9FLAO|nr:hypothetical protein [Flavobacterium chilense]SHL82784.1 hypothetical protein SAMN05444484_102717 [Flavobacterium chilense]